MKRETLVVPAGIRYMSDWAKMEGGYRLEDYRFPHIVNKQITGCGFTEYCLRNNLNIILCSPRKILLENKEDQHQGEVFYVRNGLKDSLFDKDLSKSRVQKLTKEERDSLDKNPIELFENKDTANQIREQVRHHYLSCVTSGHPCKILVTYDSFRHVRDALEEIGKKTVEEEFYVVIDEFQSIFTDSRFKSSTEIEFMSSLTGLNSLCYVSATPMIDHYLEMLDEFKDLPYYNFDWESGDSSRVIHPRLSVKQTRNIFQCANEIISRYRSGNYDKYSYLDESGKIVEIESKEAVLYFNSVANICDLIRKNGLVQEECNVLCANSDENADKVRKAFKVTKKNFRGLGRVPKIGEPHKMFTLCTRTVYLGADFYSTCAQSFIFSDSNIDCLAVDISLDLPQILGRQRLESNPWKNSATLYFKVTSENNIKTRDEFDKYLDEKKHNTELLLLSYESSPTFESKNILAKNFEIVNKFLNYRNDYVAVNRHIGKAPKPLLNNLVMVAEMRAFDIQQVDYKDRFTVFNTIKEEIVDKDLCQENKTLEDLASEIYKYTSFLDRLKYLCELCEPLSESEVHSLPF